MDAYPNASVSTVRLGLGGGIVIEGRLRSERGIEPVRRGVGDRMGVFDRIGVLDRIGVVDLRLANGSGGGGGSDGGFLGATDDGGGLDVKAFRAVGDVGLGPKGTAGSRRLSRVGRGLKRGMAIP